MKDEHKLFIKDILNALQSNSLAIFAGAGLSKPAGFVDWKELLKDITEDLGLNYSKEEDLVSIAQYNYNKVGGRSMLNAKIIDEFNKDVSVSENHKILARLPIQTYWTTNYDDLIEKSITEAKRIPDVKHSMSQLSDSKPRRDAIVFKMHGDATLPNEAVITKDDYERYQTDRPAFVNALNADLLSKRFLFIGFSFTDPNLDYILSRVRVFMKDRHRHHYHFVKKIEKPTGDAKEIADYEYKARKQDLFVQDLKRFGLQPVYVDTYQEITEILKEIDHSFKKRTIFISGSAEEYGAWSVLEAQQLVHSISNSIIRNDYRIVNGFGWGIGSAVINGALGAVYDQPQRYSEGQLIVRPFPQFETGGKSLKVLWEEYRNRMIILAGVAIFMFGNKRKDDKIVLADGMMREFEISLSYGLIPIPIATTDYIAKEIYEIIKIEPSKYYPGLSWIIPLIEELSKEKVDTDTITKNVLEILKRLNS